MNKINFLPFPLFKFFNFYILTLLLTAALFSSCGSTKTVAYFQNSDSINFEQSRYLFDARIKPKDQITVSVNTTTPEVSIPFNLLLQNSGYFLHNQFLRRHPYHPA